MPGPRGNRKPVKGFIQEAAILDENTLVAERSGADKDRGREAPEPLRTASEGRTQGSSCRAWAGEGAGRSLRLKMAAVVFRLRRSS